MKKDRKTLCTAGISQIVIYPNGDVYRCMGDYNSGKPPLLNLLKDDFYRPKKLFPCKHSSCYAACDIDWVYRWQIEGDKVLQEDPPNMENPNFKVKDWLTQEWPDKIVYNKSHIVWTPTLLCNYDCPYCGCAKPFSEVKKNFSSAHPELSTSEWLSIFSDKILPNLDYGVLTTAGGEPFLSQSLIPVLQLVSEKFKVGLTTNLSTDIYHILKDKLIPKYNPETETGVMFTLSWHPMASRTKFDVFLSKIQLLKAHGYICTVNFVGYPEQLYAAKRYMKIFKSEGIHFVISPWVGVDKYGNEGYMEAEKLFFNKIALEHRLTNTFYSNPNQEYSADISLKDVPDKIYRGQEIIFDMEVKNSGSKNWNVEKEPIFLGCRIKQYGEKYSDEYRHSFSQNIKSGDSRNIKFPINIPKKLLPGRCEFKFDIVYEHKFWFEQKGNHPPTVLIILK